MSILGAKTEPKTNPLALYLGHDFFFPLVRPPKTNPLALYLGHDFFFPSGSADHALRLGPYSFILVMTSFSFCSFDERGSVFLKHAIEALTGRHHTSDAKRVGTRTKRDLR